MRVVLSVCICALALCAVATVESSESAYTSSSPFYPDVSSYASGTSTFASSSSLPSGSVPVICPDGQYYDEMKSACVFCASLLNCVTCSNGHSCDSCNSSEYYKLENGRCVVECDKKFGLSGCSQCTEKRCIECSDKECCASALKSYWNATASKCVDPAEALGEGCLESDGEVCTLCTAQSCCKEGEYFDYTNSSCKPCSDFGDACVHCTKGGCSDCGSSKGVALDPQGKCATCASMFGEGCTECDKMKCTSMEEGFVIIGVKSVKCSALFGECSNCSAEGCTKCAGDAVSINGYCRNCNEVFGESCLSCTSDQCTMCNSTAETVLVNGACVSCSQAFGDGCSVCDNVTGCSKVNAGYLIGKQFSMPCKVLPTSELQDYCNSDTRTRELIDRGETYSSASGHDAITFQYKGQEVSVSCSELTPNCSVCTDADGQAKCLECSSGYYLVGWTCKACNDQFPDCAECNSKGCTKCLNATMNVGVDGNCVSCLDEEQVFNAISRTCVDCSTVFSRCSKCNADMCTTCGDEMFQHNDTTGECLTCSELHGTGCTSCNSTHCEECTDNWCCVDGEKIVTVPGKNPECGTCSDFNENCSECSVTTCTKCKDGMFLDKDEGACVTCGDVFADCDECNADQCTKCLGPDTTKWILTPNGCIANDTFVMSSSTHPAPPPAPAVTTPSSSEKSGSKTGMIVGIVFGCLAFVVIVGIVIYCVVTRKSKNSNYKRSDSFYGDDEDDSNFISMAVL